MPSEMDAMVREKLRGAIWDALRQRSIPVKYAYLAGTLCTEDALETDEHASNKTTLSFLTQQLYDYCMVRSLLPSQLAEIGPGNGLRTIDLLTSAHGSRDRFDRYLALDISKGLLDIATSRIRNALPRLSIAQHVWDFETTPTKSISKWRSASPLVVTCLGGTLGNAQDPHRVLTNLAASVRSGDVLLLGLHMATPEIPAVEPYTNELAQAAILAPLELFGINLHIGKYEARYLADRAAIVADFVFSVAYSVMFRDERLSFSPGDSVEVFVSRRFKTDQVAALLSQSGWRLVAQFEGTNAAEALFLAERVRPSAAVLL